MKNRGFTLIELLSVIALVAILSGLVIALVGRVRESAKNVACLSNLRQIGTAFQLYAADHRGMITPRAYEGEFDSSGQSVYTHWYRRLGRGGYVSKSNSYGDSEIFYCPSYPPNAPNDSSVENPLNVQQRYGMRNWVPPGEGALNDPSQLLRLNSIENPADFFLVTDSARVSLSTQAYSVPQGEPDWRIHLRHNTKANTLFADGHVAGMGRDYFADLHTRQFYGGQTNGRPFYLWPEN